MELFILSFIAGVLTILAPCILPLLPIIVGGSVSGKANNWQKPLTITASLAVSVIVFTLLLKASTTFLNIPAAVWELISGVIIMLLGATLVWPNLWEPLGAKLNIKTGKLLGTAGKHKGVVGDIITGASLGPVFTSCSPTFALIIATILPASFGVGLIYLSAYAAGLAGFLLVIALVGQKIIAKLQWATNPRGWFKRTVGVIFIIVGVLIATGLQKQFESYLVSQGWYDPFSRFEQSLMR